jgi:hypothetical protein
MISKSAEPPARQCCVGRPPISLDQISCAATSEDARGPDPRNNAKLKEYCDVDREERKAISVTRDWLRNHTRRTIPGGNQIDKDYRRFKLRLPRLCRELKLHRSEMTFNDFSNIVIEWLKDELRLVYDREV